MKTITGKFSKEIVSLEELLRGSMECSHVGLILRTCHRKSKQEVQHPPLASSQEVVHRRQAADLLLHDV